MQFTWFLALLLAVCVLETVQVASAAPGPSGGRRGSTLTPGTKRKRDGQPSQGYPGTAAQRQRDSTVGHLGVSNEEFLALGTFHAITGKYPTQGNIMYQHQIAKCLGKTHPINLGNNALLLALQARGGDIEARTFKEIVKQNSENLKAALLICQRDIRGWNRNDLRRVCISGVARAVAENNRLYDDDTYMTTEDLAKLFTSYPGSQVRG